MILIIKEVFWATSAFLLLQFINIDLKLTFINFQTKKQKLAVKEKQDNELKERLSLSIPLVDEIEEDVKIAKLLSYKTSDSKYQY